MWSDAKKYPSRGFMTPPPSRKSRPASHSPVMPLSERKRRSPVNKGDPFHVIHKVPAGDSPYVKAKRAQLIDKDPSRAISLFWAAINAGDRVDSALKDMAVVMKQLDRSDEAIEAIKSFRHLCSYDSQESIDNVLIELYKRSGRIEEEIEMLQRKLKQIEDGLAFSGRKTKIARSQGRKVQVTVDQERSRIIGNLAWAFLQLKDYEIAEEHYRKALSLEPDKNKQCNLAICLMYRGGIAEARSLLLDVRVQSRTKNMDESCAKSFERATQLLSEFESRSAVNMAGHEKNGVSGFTVGGRGADEGTALVNDFKRKSYSHHQGENSDNDIRYEQGSSRYRSYGQPRSQPRSSPDSTLVHDWRRSPGYTPPNNERNSRVQLVEPRRTTWGFRNGHEKRDEWKEEHTVSSLNRKLSFEQFSGEVCRQNSWGEHAHEKDTYVQCNTRALVNQEFESSPWKDSGYGYTQEQNNTANHNQSEHTVQAITLPQNPNEEYHTFVNSQLTEPSNCKDSKKSWADLVEEEEEQQEHLEGNANFLREDWVPLRHMPCTLMPPSIPCSWTVRKEDFNDENRNDNIVRRTDDRLNHIDGVKKKLQSLVLTDEYSVLGTPDSSEKSTVKRSLMFKQLEKCHSAANNYCLSSLKSEEPQLLSESESDFLYPKRRNRLQVFRDITP